MIVTEPRFCSGHFPKLEHHHLMISTDLTDRWPVTHTHIIPNIFVDAEKSHIQSLEVEMVVLNIMQNYVVN